MSTPLPQAVQTRVLGIQGPPGPTGPEGPQGDPGPVSPSGEIALLGFGDSLTSSNHNGARTTRLGSGFITVAQFLLGERLIWDGALNLGVSGENTTAFAARLTQITTAKEKFPSLRGVVFLGGTNDAPTIPAATVKSNYTTIFKHIRQTLGLDLFIIPVPPRNDAQWGASNVTTSRAYVNDLNAWLEAYCNTHEYCYFIDCYDDISDGNDQYGTGMTYDGLHFAEPAGKVIGTKLAAALEARYGKKAFDRVPTNFLKNPTLDGTGGTGSTSNLTVTGDKADDWVFSSAVSGGTNTLVITKNADGSTRYAFNSSGGTANHTVNLTQNILAGVYQAGDVLQGQLDFSIVSATNCRYVGLTVTDKPANTARTSFSATSLTSNRIQPLPRGVSATERFTVAANNTSIDVVLSMVLDSSAVAAQLVIDVYEVGLKLLSRGPLKAASNIAIPKDARVVPVDTSAARALTLSTAPDNNQEHIIYDLTGSANSNNITVDAGSGNTITDASGASQTKTISTNGGRLRLIRSAAAATWFVVP